jgi:hypothetical protein
MPTSIDHNPHSLLVLICSLSQCNALFCCLCFFSSSSTHCSCSSALLSALAICSLLQMLICSISALAICSLLQMLDKLVQVSGRTAVERLILSREVSSCVNHMLTAHGPKALATTLRQLAFQNPLCQRRIESDLAWHAHGGAAPSKSPKQRHDRQTARQ